MAISSQQLSDGVFLINWVCQTYSANSSTEVNLNVINQTCKLSYNVTSSYTTLNVKFTPMNETADADFCPNRVWAIKFGVKQAMQLEASNWKTTFTSTYFCCGGRGLIFEILIENGGRKQAKHVIEQLLHLWETKTSTDVVFDVEFNGKTTKVRAHSQILASGSPVLAAMFQGDFKEAEKRVAVIKDVKPEVFEKLLRFIYTGDAVIELATVSDLLEVAERYSVEPLKEECAFTMATSLSVENAITFLVQSHLNNSASLHQATLDFMSKNAKAICSRREWLDVIKVYPELSFVAMQNMAMW